MRKGLIPDLLVISIALLIFGCLTFFQIEAPGLYYDEAADVVPSMQILTGQKVELVNDAGIWVGGKAFPLMAMDYVGAVNSYLAIPFFLAFGISTFAVRFAMIFASMGTVLATYFLVKGLFNRPIATIAILLLVTHPSFVFWSRQGIHVTSVMGLLAVTSLLLFLRWHRGKGSPNLYTAGFLLGTGISAKLLFVWFLFAFVGGYLLLFPKVFLRALGLSRYPGNSQALSFTSSNLITPPVGQLSPAEKQTPQLFSTKLRPEVTFSQMAISLCFVLLGSWMILLYNIESQGTLAVLQKNLVTTSNGVNNLDFLANLLSRWDAFLALLHGGHLWYLGGPFPNWLYPILFGISVPGSLVLAAKSRFTPFLRPTIYIGIVCLLVVLESVVTVSGLGPTHYFALLPLVQIPMATFIYLLAKRFRPTLVSVTLATIVAFLMIGSNSYTDYLYHRSLSENGGLMTHSDAIYRLSSYLDNRGIEKPIAMDWGIKTSVQILTQGRINPVEIFQYEKEPNPIFYDWLYGALTGTNTVYVFHTDDAAIFPRFAAFKSLADKLDKKPVLEQTILQRDGRPIFLVYSVK